MPSTCRKTRLGDASLERFLCFVSQKKHVTCSYHYKIELIECHCRTAARIESSNDGV